MALPASTEPLRLAVLNALTATTGKTRAIPDAYLFVTGKPGSDIARSGSVKSRPVAHVSVKNHTADPDALFLEMSDRRREVVLVEVVCTYYAGSELFGAEYDAALLRVEEDRQRIIRALLYPEALALDPTGAETGLDGGSLRFDGYSSTGPARPNRGSARLLEVTHAFRVKVELLNS